MYRCNLGVCGALQQITTRSCIHTPCTGPNPFTDVPTHTYYSKSQSRQFKQERSHIRGRTEGQTRVQTRVHHASLLTAQGVPVTASGSYPSIVPVFKHLRCNCCALVRQWSMRCKCCFRRFQHFLCLHLLRQVFCKVSPNLVIALSQGIQSSL